MNSFDLKIIKTAELPEALEMGFDYAIGARMAVTSIEKSDNEDGSFTYTHKGRLIHIEVVNKLGKTFKAVAKGSKSQVLRHKILERGDAEYYDKVMSLIIDNLDEVLALFKI